MTDQPDIWRNGSCPCLDSDGTLCPPCEDHGCCQCPWDENGPIDPEAREQYEQSKEHPMTDGQTAHVREITATRDETITEIDYLRHAIAQMDTQELARKWSRVTIICEQIKALRELLEK